MKHKKQPIISVVIPCHNHGNELPPTVKRAVESLKKSKMAFELIVVTDGCSDNSEAVARALSERYSNIHALCFAHRQGKGGAIAKGFQLAKGKYIGFIDADMAIDPAYIPLAVSAMEKNSQIDGVLGNRITYDTTFVRKIISWGYRFCTTVLFALPFMDTQAGFKFFRKQAADILFEELTARGFGFDIDVIIHARQHNMVLFPLPVQQRKVEASNVHSMTILRVLRETIGVYHHMFHGRYVGKARFVSIRHLVVYPLSWVLTFIVALAEFCAFMFEKKHQAQIAVQHEKMAH